MSTSHCTPPKHKFIGRLVAEIFLLTHTFESSNPISRVSDAYLIFAAVDVNQADGVNKKRENPLTFQIFFALVISLSTF